jgi:hypothetical protein
MTFLLIHWPLISGLLALLASESKADLFVSTFVIPFGPEGTGIVRKNMGEINTVRKLGPFTMAIEEFMY